jgi:predicted metal-dependent phosphoesterase TrpH
VVRRARAAGLAAIALTDHDTMDGVPAALREGARIGVRVVSGCEFSVDAAWGEMHVLGYFLPPDADELLRFLTGARAMRLDRARRMVEHLQAWGADISLDDVLREADSGAVGRPHVARALVRHGTVASVGAAFDEFLGVGRRAYEPKVLPAFAEVAALVHRAGGIVSAAHLRDRATRPTLARLREEGLDAVEVRHPRHTPEIARTIEAHARALALARTGGTDWHGDGDTEHVEPLGAFAVPLEWLDEMEVRAEGLRAER